LKRHLEKLKEHSKKVSTKLNEHSKNVSTKLKEHSSKLVSSIKSTNFEYFSQPIMGFRQIFLYSFIALGFVHVFALFKSDFFFPGLIDRTSAVIIPLAILIILFYTPWSKIGSKIHQVYVSLNIKQLKFLEKLELDKKANKLEEAIHNLDKTIHNLSIQTIIRMLQEEKVKTFFKYGFLVLLTLVTLSSLKFEITNFISKPLLEIQFPLTIITIIFGAITFWQNKSIIEEIEEEQNQEEKEEEKRALEFNEKYPKLAKIPLIGKITKWGYKEGWVYSAIFAVLLIIFAFLLFYNLGEAEFKEDEFQVVAAAKGFQETGKFYQWDWAENKLNKNAFYDRAWPHTILIAGSYHLFGVSEWSSRLVSALFGLIFIFSGYFIIKYFSKNKKITLLILFVLMFYSSFINLFRYTRMYALLIPLFLILFYALYRFIIEKNNFKTNNKIFNWVFENLNYNYLILVPVLILLYFNYQVHINSLLIVPSIAIFLFCLSIIYKKKKFIIPTIISLLGAVIVFLLYYFGILNKYVSFFSLFERENFVYIDYLTSFPFFKEIGVILILLVLFILILNKFKNKFLLYSLVITGFSLFFLIWIGNRYASFVYISHIITISIILILISYYYITKLFDKKFLKIGLYLTLIFLLGVSFFESISDIYYGENQYGSFNEAYNIIEENFDLEKDVLFGQYLRTYYLKDLFSKSQINTISMLSDKQYSFDQFMGDLNKHESGWITWETRKSYHVQLEIRKYVNENFEKYSGQGVNETNVEVFYFNKNKLK